MKHNLSEILCLKGTNLYLSVSTSVGEGTCFWIPRFVFLILLIAALEKRLSLLSIESVKKPLPLGEANKDYNNEHSGKYFRDMPTSSLTKVFVYFSVCYAFLNLFRASVFVTIYFVSNQDYFVHLKVSPCLCILWCWLQNRECYRPQDLEKTRECGHQWYL